MATASQPIPLTRQRTSWLLTLAERWHLLSLDAPCVAVLWAWSFSKILGVTLPDDSLLLLFAGTWILYVTDRLLDGFRKDGAHLRERHFFYIRHRVSAIVVAIPVTLFAGWVAFARTMPAARRADLIIFSVAIAYFGLVHVGRRAVDRWFPKEVVVSLVFAAATTVPAWVASTHHHTVLLLIATLFGSLCWLNCIAIEKWERNTSTAASNRIGFWGQRHLFSVSATVGVSALVMAGYFLCIDQVSAAALCLAIVLSVDRLVVLDHDARPTFYLRIAADAALLTPVFLMFFLR